MSIESMILMYTNRIKELEKAKKLAETKEEKRKINIQIEALQTQLNNAYNFS